MRRILPPSPSGGSRLRRLRISGMRVALGADHAGVALKDALKRELDARGIACEDFGTHGPASVDYPDFASRSPAASAPGASIAGCWCAAAASAWRSPPTRCPASGRAAIGDLTRRSAIARAQRSQRAHARRTGYARAACARNPSHVPRHRVRRRTTRGTGPQDSRDRGGFKAWGLGLGAGAWGLRTTSRPASAAPQVIAWNIASVRSSSRA